jgi:hypothetical protein
LANDLESSSRRKANVRAGRALALRQEDAAPARELVRGLVEAIVLLPEDGRLKVEVRGELAEILRRSGCANAKAPAARPELLAEQIKMVAGTRNWLDLLLVAWVAPWAQSRA